MTRMLKYIAALLGIVTVLSVCILLLPVAKRQEETDTTTVFYRLRLDSGDLLMCKSPDIQIKYFTDNVNFILYDNVYCFEYENNILYVTDINFNPPEGFSYIDTKRARVIFNSEIDTDSLLSIISLYDETGASYINVYPVAPSMELYNQVELSDTCISYQLLRTSSGDLFELQQLYYDNKVSYAITPNISEDWWVSPMGRLILNDLQESYQLDLIPNCG